MDDAAPEVAMAEVRAQTHRQWPGPPVLGVTGESRVPTVDGSTWVGSGSTAVGIVSGWWMLVVNFRCEKNVAVIHWCLCRDRHSNQHNQLWTCFDIFSC